MRFIHIIHMVVIGRPLAERANRPTYILDARWLWRREQCRANLWRYRRACQFARNALIKEAACHRLLEQRIARTDQSEIQAPRPREPGDDRALPGRTASG